MVAVPVPRAPTEANIDSLRRTSVCPLGHVTRLSASAIDRRTSKEVSHWAQRYSYRAIGPILRPSAPAGLTPRTTT